MGLMVHSLSDLPLDIERDFYIYLLDFGWEGERVIEIIDKNFSKIAELAAKNKSVFMRGAGMHFADEVMSWHNINGQPGGKILPALLITTAQPHDFLINPKKNKLLLIPIKKVCQKSDEIIDLIQKIFSDIKAKKPLADFEVAKELKAGKDGALTDALILQPNISGIGIDLNYILKFFHLKK